MSKTKPLVALVLAAGLTGCGTSYDCGNSDVHETLANAVLDRISELQQYTGHMNATAAQYTRAKELVSDVKIVDIQTVSENDDHTRYECKAKYQLDGKEVAVDYNVNAIENSDSPFEIEYDNSAAQSMAGAVMSTARSQAQ